MTVDVLYGKRKSCLYCTTTGRAFGPVFGYADAEDFLDWLDQKAEHDGCDPDPRSYSPDEFDALKEEFESWRDGRGEWQDEAKARDF